MILSFLALVAVLQTQAPGQQVVQVAAFSPTKPAVDSSTPPAPPATTSETAADSWPSDEPAAEPVRTRQVCRYIEVTGQRFPVRSCRTVVIEPDDR